MIRPSSINKLLFILQRAVNLFLLIMLKVQNAFGPKIYHQPTILSCFKGLKSVRLCHSCAQFRHRLPDPMSVFRGWRHIDITTLKEDDSNQIQTLNLHVCWASSDLNIILAQKVRWIQHAYKNRSLGEFSSFWSQHEKNESLNPSVWAAAWLPSIYLSKFNMLKWLCCFVSCWWGGVC